MVPARLNLRRRSAPEEYGVSPSSLGSRSLCEPRVVRDNTISKSRFTGEKVRGLPTGDLSEMITLGAGIYEATVFSCCEAQTGFVFRGGRVTECGFVPRLQARVSPLVFWPNPWSADPRSVLFFEAPG